MCRRLYLPFGLLLQLHVSEILGGVDVDALYRRADEHDVVSGLDGDGVQRKLGLDIADGCVDRCRAIVT